MKIGDLRRSLFLDFDCRWNGKVREITAQHEKEDEEVDPADVHAALILVVKTEAMLDQSVPLEKGSRLQRIFEESK